MRDRTITQYVGMLLRSSRDAGRAAVRVLDEQLEELERLAGWHTYEFGSTEPLLDESTSGPFTYRVYVVFGRALGAVIALEPVLEKVTQNVLGELSDELRRVTVNIDGLVDDIAAGIPYRFIERDRGERAVRFLLSYLHARTPGLGVDIKSVTMYGDNISSGRIFKEHRELFNVATCGIRRASTKEIVKIGSDGSLTLQVKARWVEQRLHDLNHVMGYVLGQGHILDAGHVTSGTISGDV